MNAFVTLFRHFNFNWLWKISKNFPNDMQPCRIPLYSNSNTKYTAILNAYVWFFLFGFGFFFWCLRKRRCALMSELLSMYACAPFTCCVTGRMCANEIAVQGSGCGWEQDGWMWRSTGRLAMWRVVFCFAALSITFVRNSWDGVEFFCHKNSKFGFINHEQKSSYSTKRNHLRTDCFHAQLHN